MRRSAKMSFEMLIENNKKEILSNADSIKKIEDKIETRYQQRTLTTVKNKI